MRCICMSLAPASLLQPQQEHVRPQTSKSAAVAYISSLILDHELKSAMTEDISNDCGSIAVFHHC
jgi:hypothetical protein